MLLLFAGGLWATYVLLQVVPSAFVPEEDEGYFICIVQAPAGASLEYTTEIAKKAEKVIYARARHRRRVLGDGLQLLGRGAEQRLDLRAAEGIRGARGPGALACGRC